MAICGSAVASAINLPAQIKRETHERSPITSRAVLQSSVLVGWSGVLPYTHK